MSTNTPRPVHTTLVTAIVAVVLASTAVAGAAAADATRTAPRSAAVTVIDAGTDAQAAADAINTYCSDREKCEWNNDVAVDSDFGPDRIVGDVLYNCSAEADAETAVGVSDERGESTGLQESLSLEASLGILGLAKSSVEFTAYSKQNTYVGSTVKSTKAVGVPAGYKGWTDASMRSALMNGTVSVTSGINLMVSNVDLSLAGYLADGAPRTTPMAVYSGTAIAMTAQEIEDNCPTTAPTRPGTTARTITPGRETFRITLCKPMGSHGLQPRACVRRKVSGRQAPPDRDLVRATLTRAGVTYAVERNRKGAIRLIQRRPITPGNYLLTLREKSQYFVVRRNNGNRLHRARQDWYVHVPLRIRWHSAG